MTILSVKSVSSRLNFRERFLKLFREYAHLIAEGENDSEDRFPLRQ